MCQKNTSPASPTIGTDGAPAYSLESAGDLCDPGTAAARHRDTSRDTSRDTARVTARDTARVRDDRQHLVRPRYPRICARARAREKRRGERERERDGDRDGDRETQTEPERDSQREGERERSLRTDMRGSVLLREVGEHPYPVHSPAALRVRVAVYEILRAVFVQPARRSAGRQPGADRLTRDDVWPAEVLHDFNRARMARAVLPREVGARHAAKDEREPRLARVQWRVVGQKDRG
jgi:hypothetical protein